MAVFACAFLAVFDGGEGVGAAEEIALGFTQRGGGFDEVDGLDCGGERVEGA